MSDEEKQEHGKAYGEPPGLGAMDWIIFVLCVGFPWLWSPHIGAGMALACMFGWFFFVRPTWRGLLPTFLTAVLILNVVVRAVQALSWVSQTWSPF